MKKVLALILAVLMVCSLVACAAKPAEAPAAPAEESAPAAEAAPAKEEAPAKEAPAEEAPADEALPYEGVTLKWWNAPINEVAMPYVENMLADFEAQTGAKVELTQVPWDEFNTKFLAGFMSGEGPDLLYTTPDNIYDMAEAGVLADLNQYFSADELAERKQIDAGKLLGGLYAVPYYIEYFSRGFAFNMDLLAEAGVTEIPKTFDELIDVAVKVKEANVCEYPLTLNGGGGTDTVMQSWNPVLYSMGGSIADADGNITLNTPEALAAAQYIDDLVQKYGVLSTDTTAFDDIATQDLFREGKVAITSCQPGFYTDPETFFLVSDEGGKETAYDPFKYVITLGFANDGQIAKMQNNVDMLSVGAGENEEAAVALLKFMTTREAMAGLIESRDVWRQGRSNLYVDSPLPDFKADWAADYLKAAADGYFGSPIIRGFPGVLDAIFANYQMLVMGELTPQECIDSMQAAAEAATAG